MRDLPELLRAGDALVVNDTRVISARLIGRRIGRGDAEPRVEATAIQTVGSKGWDGFAIAIVK